MPKLTLTDITSGYASTTQLNANFAAIETALENTVSRDGTTPNTMSADLDMNGHLILNQANPIAISNFEWNGNWVTATAYTVGDIVYEPPTGTAYICVVAHTSGTFATDLSAIKWQVFATSALPPQNGQAAKFLQTNGSSASWEVPDSVEVSFLQSGTGAVATTVQAKLRESVSVFDFMTAAQVADVQARTALVDVSAALQAAFTAHESVRIPAGTYAVSAALTVANKSIRIVGDGMGVTILKFNGTNGIEFSINSSFDVVTLKDFSMYQDGAALGYAVSYDGTGQKTTNLSTRTEPRFVAENIQMIGTALPTADGWLRGFSCNNLMHGTFDGVHFTGKYTTTLDATDSTEAFYFYGDGAPVEIQISNSWAFYVDSAVKSVAVEGITVSNCNFVAVGRGVYVVNTSAEPGFLVSNCHIAAFIACVDLTYANQSIISDNLFYLRDDAVAAGTGVLLTDSNYNKIHGNIFVNTSASYGFNGVVLVDSAATTNFNSIHDNFFQVITDAITVGANCTSNSVFDNNFATVTNRLVNNGSTTRYGGRFGTVNNSAAVVIGDSSATAFTFDQAQSGPAEYFDGANPTRITALIPGIYRVTAHVVFASNATGIRYYEVKKNGSSVVGLPGESAAAISGYNNTMSGSGIIKLTAAEYLELYVYQSSGGNMSMPAVLTWLSLEMLSELY